MATITVTTYMPVLDMATLEMEPEEQENRIKMLEETNQLKYAWTNREIDTDDILECFDYKPKKDRTVVRLIDDRLPMLIQENFNSFVIRKQEIITQHMLLSTGAIQIEWAEEENIEKELED